MGEKMDFDVEKYIFESINKGFKSGFIEVRYPNDGYPRFLTFSNGIVKLHSCGSSDVMWHFAPGKVIAELEHIVIESVEAESIKLSFNSIVKKIEFSIASPGVYWGR